MKSLWSELNELKRENAELKDTIEKCWEAICEPNDGDSTLAERIDALVTRCEEISNDEYVRLFILHHIVKNNPHTMAKLQDIVFKDENDCFDGYYQAMMERKHDRNAK
jgi:hypothetical protein